MERRSDEPTKRRSVKSTGVDAPEEAGAGEAQEAGVTIRFPFVPREERRAGEYFSTQISGALSQAQADSLKGLLDGLRAEHAQLESGRHVESAMDAVRWVLEVAAREYSTRAT